MRTIKEFSTTNEPAKIKTEKSITESEFIWRGFNKQENKFKGKTALDLSESNGKIPVAVTLESLDERIKVDIPENTIFKTDDGELYN